MLAVNGTYENGKIKLDRNINSKKKLKVIVTFLEDDLQNESKILKPKDFSFQKAREISKNLKSSLSDAIIEERRNEL
jgi:hypothetical protein